MSERRIAVITGGASGIGHAAARRFAAEGDIVVIADMNADSARAVADELISIGGEAHGYAVDVSQEPDVDNVIEVIEQDVGPIGVLVNSAGLFQNPSGIAELPMEQHDALWMVNNRGLYMCCRAVAKRMIPRGRGAIVNMASSMSYMAWPLTAYSPGKAAVKSLTEILAAELGGDGIRVNAVAPHGTLTPQIQARIDAGERDPVKLAADNAIPRLIKPEEVSAGIFFLCSDEASAITGVTLPIDCGYLAAYAYRTYPA